MSPPDPAPDAGSSLERSLPIRVPLGVGESLDSWIEALASRNGVLPVDLLAALGLPPPRTAYGLMLGLPPEQLRRIERQAGLPDRALDGAVLDPYLALGVVAPSRRALPVALWRRWTRGAGTSFCPACLAQTAGRWQRRWYLRWSFACLDHRALLATGCPRCGRSPRSGEARWTHRDASARCGYLDPACTVRNFSSPRCGADLSAHPHTPLPDDHPLLCAQRFIEDLLCPVQVEQPVPVAGLTVPRTVAVEALAALIRAVLLGRHDLTGYDVAVRGAGVGRRSPIEGIDLPEWPAARSPATALQAGTDPALFGVAAALAVDALQSRSLVAAGDPVMRILDGPHPGRPPNDPPAISGLRLRHPDDEDDQALAHGRAGIPSFHGGGEHRLTIGDPVVDAVLLRRAATTTRLAERLSYRTDNPIPRRPAPRDATSELRWPHRPGQSSSVPARLIPQCAWPEVISVLPARVARRDTIAFAATVSMALVRIGTFAPWSQIALQLGLPSQLASRVNIIWRNLRVGGDDVPMTAALDSLVDVLLDRPPPIDYARRRAVFRTLDPVPTTRMRRACHQAGLVATARRRRYTTMLIWETLTESDIRLHPGDLGPLNRADRSAYAAFCATDAVLIAEFVTEEAERRLLRHRIDEPVTWTPRAGPQQGPGGGLWCAPDPGLTRRLSGWSAPSQARASTHARVGGEQDARLSALVDQQYRLVPGLVSDLWRFRIDRPQPRPGMAHPSRGAVYAGPELASGKRVPHSIREAEEFLDLALLEPSAERDDIRQLTPTGMELINRHCYSVCGPYEYDPWARVADGPEAARRRLPPDHTPYDPFRLQPRHTQPAPGPRSSTPDSRPDRIVSTPHLRDSRGAEGPFLHPVSG